MTAATGDPPRDALSSFSITTGGAVDACLARLHLGGLEPGQVARRAVVLAFVSWVPLVLAALAEGTLFGGERSLAMDIGVHARVLVALPLLLIGERAVGRRFREALGHLEQAGMISESRAPRIAQLVARARRARDTPVADLAILVAVAGLSLFDATHPSAEPRWMFERDAAGELSLSSAGWIEVLLCAPLYRIVLLRWLYRWCIWVAVLAGLSRIGLRLSALHADRMGGLGVLAEAHTSCGWVLGALAVTLAGRFTTQRLLLDLSVSAFTHSSLVFAVIGPAICLLPMLFFAWPLELAKRRAHHEYSVVSADFARRYRRAHLEPHHRVPVPLGSGAPSAAEDIGASFERVLHTRMIPIGHEHLLFLAACALGPLVLFYLQELPILEILRRLHAVLG